MADDIERIRLELDELRKDTEAFFNRIDQHFAENPNADSLILPGQEEMNLTPLRRRAAAAMGKVGSVVYESPGAPITGTELRQFAEAVRQMRAAFELKQDKASGDPPDVTYDGAPEADQCQRIPAGQARKVVLKAIQAAKELLGLASGNSHYTPAPTASKPVTSSAQVIQLSSWSELKIMFVSDERVQVTAKDFSATWNYTEFGFTDRRNGKPSQA